VPFVISANENLCPSWVVNTGQKQPPRAQSGKIWRRSICRALSADAPEVALLLHTGYTSATQTREAIAAGAAAVVLKTLRGDTLLQAVHGLAPPSI
jgi:hypothetical protein